MALQQKIKAERQQMVEFKVTPIKEAMQNMIDKKLEEMKGDKNLIKNQIQMLARRKRFWNNKTTQSEISALSKLQQTIAGYYPKPFKPQQGSKLALLFN